MKKAVDPMMVAMSGLAGGLRGFAQSRQTNKALEIEKLKIESHEKLQQQLIDIQKDNQELSEELKKRDMSLLENKRIDKKEYDSRMLDLQKNQLNLQRHIADMQNSLDQDRLKSDNQREARRFIMSVIPMMTQTGQQVGADPELMKGVIKGSYDIMEADIERGTATIDALAGWMNSVDVGLDKIYGGADRDPTNSPQAAQFLDTLLSSDSDTAPLWGDIKPMLMGENIISGPPIKTESEAGKELREPTIPSSMVEAARGFEERTSRMENVAEHEAYVAEGEKRAGEKLLDQYEKAREGIIDLLKNKNRGQVTIPEKVVFKPSPATAGYFPVTTREKKTSISAVDAMRMKLYSKEISARTPYEKKMETVERLVTMPDAMIKSQYRKEFPESKAIPEL